MMCIDPESHEWGILPQSAQYSRLNRTSPNPPAPPSPDLSIVDVPQFRNSGTDSAPYYRKYTRSWVVTVCDYNERANYIEKWILIRPLYGYAENPYTVRYASGSIPIVSAVSQVTALVGLGISHRRSSRLRRISWPAKAVANRPLLRCSRSRGIPAGGNPRRLRNSMGYVQKELL